MAPKLLAPPLLAALALGPHGASAQEDPCHGVEAVCIESDLSNEISFEEMTQGCQCCFMMQAGGDVDLFQFCLFPLFPQVDFCIDPGNAQNNPGGAIYDCRHECEAGTWEEQNAAGCHGDNFGNQHEDQVCVTEGLFAPGEMMPSGEACCEWCDDWDADGNPDYEGCCEGMRADEEMGCENRHCDWLCEGLHCGEHREDQMTCESNGGVWVVDSSCDVAIAFQAMMAHGMIEDGLGADFAATMWLSEHAEVCCNGYEPPGNGSCDHEIDVYVSV